MRQPGIYLITRENTSLPDLLAVVDQALHGGCVLVQYRDKSSAAEIRLAQAKALLKLCRVRDIPLLINDDVQLALACGADGVHLGKNDLGLAQARSLLGKNAIIGASCYDSLELAAKAKSEGADYLAFGRFYPSGTKPHAPAARLETIAQAKALALPRVAVGGIDARNADTLIRLGVEYLAVLGAIFDAEDPFQATRELTKLFP